MNRRDFVAQLAGIGLFTILPGAGRIWKATHASIEHPYLHECHPDWTSEQIEIYYRLPWIIFREGHDRQKDNVIHKLLTKQKITLADVRV